MNVLFTGVFCFLYSTKKRLYLLSSRFQLIFQKGTVGFAGNDYFICILEYS